MRLYSLLVLVGWIGLGEAMKCALISMQGQHYTQPQHVAMGQYAVMKKKSGGHAVYELASMQQSKHPLYLYFRKSEGFWCIGPTIGSKKYQLYMRSQEETPLSTRLSGSWHVQINPKSFKSGAFVRALNVKADCVSAPMAAGELTTPVVGSSAGAVFGDEEPYSGGDQSGEFHGVSTQTLVFASCAAAVVVMISWTALGKQLAKAAAAREAEALEAGVVPSVGNAYQESSGLIN